MFGVVLTIKEWYKQVFEDLKQVMTQALVLALPDFSKPYS